MSSVKVLSCAYPKNHRLLKSNDFKRSKNNQKKQKSTYFTISYSINNFENARLGIIVTKRCTKLAVKRNKLKRVIRESFREIAQKLPRIDCIVIIHPTVHSTDFKTLRKELDKKWEILESFG